MTATVTRIHIRERWDFDIPLDSPPTPRALRRRRTQAVGDAVCAAMLVAAGAAITLGLRRGNR